MTIRDIGATSIDDFVDRAMEHIVATDYNRLVYEIAKTLNNKGYARITDIMREDKFIAAVGDYEIFDIYYAFGIMEKYGFFYTMLSDMTVLSLSEEGKLLLKDE